MPGIVGDLGVAEERCENEEYKWYDRFHYMMEEVFFDFRIVIFDFRFAKFIDLRISINE